MALNDIDPSTFIVPLNQVLIFLEDNITKYKRSTGTIGSLPSEQLLQALGISVDALPSLVYDTDLQKCLNTSFYLVLGITIASTAKASVLYVQRETNKKLDKTTYLNDMLSTIKEIAHDANFLGKGTKQEPLQLSLLITQKLQKITELLPRIAALLNILGQIQESLYMITGEVSNLLQEIAGE